MILLIYSILIILAALTDALFFAGDKAVSKLVEELFTIGLITIPIVYRKDFNVWYIVGVIIMYIFLRIALFDLAFNIFAGLKLTFVGTTDFLWSDLIRELTMWQNIILRVWFLTLAFLIYKYKLKKI